MKHLRFSSFEIHVRLLATLAAVVTLSSCEMKKNLDEMHDSTMDMSKTTEKMEKSTSAMKDLTTELRDSTVQVQAQTAEVGATSARLEGITGEMFDAIKQRESLGARRDGLKSVAESTDGGKKCSEAAKYFMSFEFQLWSGLGQDTPERRAELMASGAKEFMREVQEFVEPDQDVASPSAGPGDQKNQNLNAIAVALHYVNPKQTELIHKKPELTVVTMYSILKEALTAGQQIAAGKKTLRDYPAYVREVLNHERVAKLIMQVRYNYFGAMALAKVTKVRSGFLAKERMFLLSWKLDVSKIGITELQDTALYMEGALGAFDFMRSVGIEPVLTSKLARIYNNMKLSEATTNEVLAVRKHQAAVAAGDKTSRVSAHAVAATSLAELMRYYALSAKDKKLKLPVNARNVMLKPAVEVKH